MRPSCRLPIIPNDTIEFDSRRCSQLGSTNSRILRPMMMAISDFEYSTAVLLVKPFDTFAGAKRRFAIICKSVLKRRSVLTLIIPRASARGVERVYSEPEAGDSRPCEKRNFLTLMALGALNGHLWPLSLLA